MTVPNKNQPQNQQNLQNINEIKSLKSNRILIALNYMINQMLYYKNNYYESEFTIADKTGISRRTICRAVKLGKQLGLFKRRRRINQSNIYSLNPLLRRPEIIDELASVLPALRGLLCLSFLIPMTMICQPSVKRTLQEFGTQYLKEVYLTSCALNLTVENTKKEASHFKKEPGPGLSPVENTKKEARHFGQEAQALRDIAIEIEEALKREMPNQDTMQSAIFMQELRSRSTNDYVDERSVREYKEFMQDRLPRLVESVGALALAPDKKHDIIARQVQSYKDRLHFKDCIKLRAEGYDV